MSCPIVSEVLISIGTPSSCPLQALCRLVPLLSRVRLDMWAQVVCLNFTHLGLTRDPPLRESLCRRQLQASVKSYISWSSSSPPNPPLIPFFLIQVADSPESFFASDAMALLFGVWRRSDRGPSSSPPGLAPPPFHGTETQHHTPPPPVPSKRWTRAFVCRFHHL